MSFMDFYGMKNVPFQRNIPPGYLYESSQVKEGLSRLIYDSPAQSTFFGRKNVQKRKNGF